MTASSGSAFGMSGAKPVDSGGIPDQRLSRARRLVRSVHFREAYEQGRRWVGRYMVLWVREGEGATLRLGVVASRKVGGATHRVKARRRLREAYRQVRYRLRGPVDVVLVARRAIRDAGHEDVLNELLNLAGRAGLLREGEE